jgi:hypothetical protein
MLKIVIAANDYRDCIHRAGRHRRNEFGRPVTVDSTTLRAPIPVGTFTGARCDGQGRESSQEFPASSRSRNASRRSQNGTVIAAGGTGTLLKLGQCLRFVHKAVYCSTSCHGSGYFRHCSAQRFLIEVPAGRFDSCRSKLGAPLWSCYFF